MAAAAAPAALHFPPAFPFPPCYAPIPWTFRSNCRSISDIPRPRRSSASPMSPSARHGRPSIRCGTRAWTSTTSWGSIRSPGAASATSPNGRAGGSGWQSGSFKCRPRDRWIGWKRALFQLMLHLLSGRRLAFTGTSAARCSMKDATESPFNSK